MQTQYTESFNGGWVPTTPLPDRFPSTPDDIPSRYLGDCPKCRESWHAGPASALDAIPTTACESCGEEFCTECPMGFCEVGDHTVCKACVRKLRPAGSDEPLDICLKCTGNVLDAPLGEIYQLKRAIKSAIGVIGAATSVDQLANAVITLGTAIRTCEQRGF